MSEIEIWHNPRCSKSRQTLALLEEEGIEPTVIRYLDDPPSPERLQEVLGYLGIAPRELLRRREAAYKELGLGDDSLEDEEIIAAMVRRPKLIERPVVIRGPRAAIGRPPESVLEILTD